MKQNHPYQPHKACARCYPAVALLALLLATACTQDDAPTAGYGLSGEKTSLQVAALGTADEVVTRSATAYPTTGSIGFFVKENTAGGYAAINNRKGLYEGTTHRRWLPVDSIWLNSNTADLAVYAPYDATTHGTGGTLKLVAAQRPADGSKDIAFKAFTANHTTAAPALTLAHLYARMHITITRAAEYNVDVALSTVKLHGNETYKEATYRPFDASHYAYGADKEITIAVSPEVKLNASTTTATIDLLLIPATLTGDVTLRLEGTDNQFKTVITKTGLGNTLQAGKQYNLNLKLRPGKIDLTSVSVERWDALSEVNGGNGEFDYYTPPGIQLPVGDINLGGTACTDDDKAALSKLRWALGNLKSTGSSDYDWVDPAATGADAYGYYYTFYSTYTGDNSQNNTDPCSKLKSSYGTGWKTPSYATMQKLARCTDKVITTYNGTSGMWFLSKPNGLFLPAAGRRSSYVGSGTTATDLAGSYGYYWSRDANGSYYGSGLYFNSGNASTNDFIRTFGFLVRCVQGDS